MIGSFYISFKYHWLHLIRLIRRNSFRPILWKLECWISRAHVNQKEKTVHTLYNRIFHVWNKIANFGIMSFYYKNSSNKMLHPVWIELGTSGVSVWCLPPDFLDLDDLARINRAPYIRSLKSQTDKKCLSKESIRGKNQRSPVFFSHWK